MTPELLRMVALLLSDPDAYNVCTSDEADDLARLLREHADAVEWRPIETAPRDGTWILLYQKSADEEHCCSVYVAKWATWNAYGGEQTGWYVSDENDHEFTTTLDSPTLWQPLTLPQDPGA